MVDNTEDSIVTENPNLVSYREDHHTVESNNTAVKNKAQIATHQRSESQLSYQISSREPKNYYSKHFGERSIDETGCNDTLDNFIRPGTADIDH